MTASRAAQSGSDDAVALARQLDAAPGQRIFFIDPDGGNAVARFSGNRVSFDSVVTGEHSGALFNYLRANSPGVPIVSGSGTHGLATGAWSATDASLVTGARPFYFQDLKSLGGRGSTNFVFNVGTPKGIADFLNAEQNPSVITVRSWCFSTFSCF